MNIITGYRGEPHITSAQDRAGNQGSYGTGSYVLNVGNKMAASIASSNEIRIADGALCHQGCLANIDAGTYDSVSINNGSQGLNRIDLIVARYTLDSETRVEDISLVVIQGSPVSGTPSAPSYINGNIQNGDSPVDMPLYQVRLTGVTLSSVTAVFDAVKTQAELQTELNGKMDAMGDNIIVTLPYTCPYDCYAVFELKPSSATLVYWYPTIGSNTFHLVSQNGVNEEKYAVIKKGTVISAGTQSSSGITYARVRVGKL